MAVKADIPGGLSQVKKDKQRRAVAACLPVTTGPILRGCVLCGPSAASSAGFASCPEMLRSEKLPVEWVLTDMELAFLNGWIFLAAGDMNSFPSPTLDRLDGHVVLRPEALACALLSHGGVDSFRHRPPPPSELTLTPTIPGRQAGWIRSGMFPPPTPR